MRTVAFCLLAAFVSCNSSSTPAVASAQALAVLGAAGGELVLGEASATVPPGALASPYELRLRELEGADLPADASRAWELTGRPEGGTGSFGPVTFGKPVTMTVSMDREGNDLPLFVGIPSSAALTTDGNLGMPAFGRIANEMYEANFSSTTPHVLAQLLDSGMWLEAQTDGGPEFTIEIGAHFTDAREERIGLRPIPEFRTSLGINDVTFQIPELDLTRLQTMVRIPATADCAVIGDVHAHVPIEVERPSLSPEPFGVHVVVPIDCPAAGGDRDGDYSFDLPIENVESLYWDEDLCLMVAGADGWVAVDPFTEEVKVDAVEPSTFDLFKVRALGPAGGNRVIIGAGSPTTRREYRQDTGLVQFTQLLGFASTGANVFADDPDTAVIASPQRLFFQTFGMRLLPGSVAVPNADGDVMDAVGRGERLLALSRGTPGISPGQIHLILLASIDPRPRFLANAQDDARNLELINDCFAIPNYGSATLTWGWWPAVAPDGVEIIAHIPTGDGCLGVAVKELPGGKLAAVTTNYLDHSYSLIWYDPATRDFRVRTFDLPDGAQFPTGAAFIPDVDECRIAIVADGRRVYSLAVSFDFE